MLRGSSSSSGVHAMADSSASQLTDARRLARRQKKKVEDSIVSSDATDSRALGGGRSATPKMEGDAKSRAAIRDALECPLGPVLARLN